MGHVFNVNCKGWGLKMEIYLLNGNTACLRDQEVGEEDGNELPGTKEDVDAELQGAQHVQESCSTETHHQYT